MNLTTKVDAAITAAELQYYEPGESYETQEWIRRKSAQRLFLSAVAIDETNKLEQFISAHGIELTVDPDEVYCLFYHPQIGFRILQTLFANGNDAKAPPDHVLIGYITGCESWEDVWLRAGDTTLRFELLDDKERKKWLDNVKLSL